MIDLKGWVKQGLPVIDCRQSSEFEKAHIQTSVNLPADDLFLRMHELPEKSAELLVIVDDECRATAQQFLTERAFKIAAYCDWASVAESNADLFTSGQSGNYFWRPAPFVARCEQDYFQPLLRKGSLIFDLASGAGRDSVYLAMQGWRVVAVDSSETALVRCDTTAKHHGVSLTTVAANLEKNFSFNQFDALKDDPDAIVVCRYLHRPLFAALKQKLKPGGLIAYHTFMVGSEQFGSPRNPNYLLQQGELASIFEGYDILLDEVVTLGDGRPTSHFVARKPNAINQH